MALTTISKLPVVTPNWQIADNIVAYTSVRAGGVSKGEYASMNLGAHVGDVDDAVTANRARLPIGMHGNSKGKIQWLNQVHGNTVVQAEHCDAVPDADALFTRQAGYFCAVMTADCVPVLLVDETATCVAAVHAGWKGLANRIIAKTIAAMTDTPRNLQAWIGPCISARHYQVGAELLDVFATEFPFACIQRGANDYALDLPAIAESQLKCLGVNAVWQSGLCTYEQDDLFFSYRRTGHNNKQDCGRMVSIIGITDPLKV